MRWSAGLTAYRISERDDMPSMTRARSALRCALFATATIMLLFPGCSSAESVGPNDKGGGAGASPVEEGGLPHVDGGDSPENSLDSGVTEADVASILLSVSPECLACAEASCENAIDNCAGIAGVAEAGMARSQLCLDSLTCFLSNHCPVSDPVSCYCEHVVFQEPAPYCLVKGPCQEVFERSMEATRTGAVVDAFTDDSKGGTQAIRLLTCLQDNRCRSCFPIVTDGATDGTDP